MLPAVILAGGLATRLRPLTDAIPKSMVDVNGEPFVFHQLRLLRRRGVGRVVFCLGYRGDQVVNAVGDGSRFGVQVGYVFDGPVLLGTAGALAMAAAELPVEFFVLYGDSYLDCDYAAVEQAYRESAKPALMTVYRNEGKWGESNVECSSGRIVAYSKAKRTPRMRHVDYGLAILAKRVLEGVATDRPTDLGEIYRKLIHGDELAALEVSQRFFEVGSFEGLSDLKVHLRKAG
jgi:NDP-sugar pyrophosphorylase family protein